MATPTAPRPSIATCDDRELAALAIDGDGEAFAQLYDRHERRVFGFCLRVLGNPDEAADATQETFMRLLKRLPALRGREVNLVAYALRTARNACYDTIAARRRMEPVGERIDGSTTEARSPIAGRAEPGDIAQDPERAALLAAAREDVRAANARLPERQREVLALRELEQLSYEQIGEIVGLNENAVAQLISRARIRLRDLLRGGALESIAAASPECERALPLLARRQDEQRSRAGELDWLRLHVADCETCRLSRAAMEEAGASYRVLGPIVALVWLRHTTIARAAQLVGADWSHVAGSARGSMPHSAQGSRERAGWRHVGHPLRRLPGLAVLCVVVVATLSVAASVAPDRHVLSRQLTSVSNATSTARRSRPPDTHPTRAAHLGKAPAETPSAPRGASPVLAVRAGVPGSPASAPTSIGTPIVRQPARRRVDRRRATHHAGSSPRAPTGTPSPPPTATAPASTPTTTTATPTTTTPTPSAGGGGTETTTAPTGTPGGAPSPPTETAPGCATAFACPRG